jgi:cytochrome oxidase Cu insertion factor (SCO1/SenC/PrrC family)
MKRLRSGDMLRIWLAWLVVAASLGHPAPASAVLPGDLAPDFSLQNLQGATTTLAQFRGQLVLLAFVGYG